MENILSDTADILNLNISGFHQYILTEPVHLNYVSKNLCDMIGMTENMLLSDIEDLYSTFVHPDDRNIYFDFINKLKIKEQTISLQYRLRRSDNTYIYVNDTITSKKLDSGVMVGYSVLADITEIKNENNNLQFFNKNIPCGFMRYTCEKQPKITYINKQMMDFLRFPITGDDELDYLEMCKDNIFLMIPMEERHRFALFLNRVYSAGGPVAGEMSVMRCDGTRAYFFGWVTKCVNEQGNEEFQSVCMDITQRYQLKKEREAKRYIKVLMDVYDKIFEFDISANTVKCIYGQNSPMFKWIENIPMNMEEATENWIVSTVVEEDREAVLTFFKDFESKKLYNPDTKPPQITYKAHSSSGEIKRYTGVFLKIDNAVSLYCCRRVEDGYENNTLKNENILLKENMQELIMDFKEGIAAFEVTKGYITPLYASDNICEYFGFSGDEWLSLMKKKTQLKDFVEKCETSYDKFVSLLRKGEEEFTYYDYNIEMERRMRAICSPKDFNASPRYVLLYNMDKDVLLDNNESVDKETVYIRTFGYFDVFVDDKPIAFRSQKAKELLALLVDRRGGYISSEEAISFLWEEEPVNSITLARYRKVALRLKNILEEYGISDIIDSVDGMRCIVTKKVKCDLYDYLSGKDEFSKLFKGNYLTNYSWGENTLAELTGNYIKE